MNTNRTRNELLKALAYSDIFSYPLTGKQLFKFSGIKIQKKKFFTALTTLSHLTLNNTIYYFLPKREEIVKERIRREKISAEKVSHVKKITSFLRYIPFIHFIGISGSLALMNADKKSDSDIFIITAKNTVWLTRFLVYGILWILKSKKRKKYNPQAICANMFMSENALSLNQKKRNLYSAHEVIQVVPLYNVNQTWEKFLYKNSWVKKYFPNVTPPKRKKKIESFSAYNLFGPIDTCMRYLQLWYMKNKKTREITTPFLIAFHPIDYEQIILKEFAKKMQKIQLSFTKTENKIKVFRKKIRHDTYRQASTNIHYGI